MKKAVYLIIVAGIAVGARYAYKTFKAPTLPEETQQSTGEILTGAELTGMETTGTVSSALQEVTEEFDATDVPVVSGSEEVNVNSWVSAEVRAMIEKRRKLSWDNTKFTEEDIDLMEEIIEAVKSLWD